MSDGLQQVINYMIPAVGTPRGYFWSGVLTAAPVNIDFRNVSGGGIDGQVFRPSGVFIDNTQGTGPLTIVVNEIGYQMICLEGELLNLQFPAPIDCTVSFVGDGQATIAFVDFPVLPYRNLAVAPGAAIWGTIAGILSDQTDLQSALDAKITEPGGQTEGDVLTIVSGVPKWEVPTGGAAAFADITGDAYDNANLGAYLTEGIQKAQWSSITGTISSNAALQAELDAKTADPGANGVVVRTGVNTSVNRTITGTTNQVTVTNGDGVSGNPTISLDSDIAAIGANATNGLITRTGSGTISARTITGTANKVTVTNGDGVSGNPTLTLPDALTLVTPTCTGLLDATGGQIKFPATQVPSSDVNTLDDYEEGNWTPTIAFATNGNLSVTYSTRIGTYIKIGRRVQFTFEIVTSAFTHTTASGNLRVTGLGITSSSAQGNAYSSVTFGGITVAGYTQLNSTLAASAALVEFTASGTAVAPIMLTTTHVPTGGSVVLAGTITMYAGA